MMYLRRLSVSSWVATLLFTAAALAPRVAQSQIYVDKDATGAANGDSWEDAYNSLQNGLSEAASGTEIWVAEGTYKPDQGDNVTLGDPEERFELKHDVGVYGGFVGQETSRGDRDPQAHTTILSGDINAQGDSTDNSKQVVASVQNDRTTVLDGVTVRGAGGTSGMYIFDSDPTFRNVTFRDNAGNSGAGADVIAGDPLFDECSFSNNSENAIRVGSGSSVVVTNSTFTYNSGTNGGAINNSGTFTVVNSYFKNNESESAGGAINSNIATTNAVNVVFIGNESPVGGAVFSGSSDSNFSNSTFANNTADSGFSGGISAAGEDSNIEIRNSIFWANEGFAQIRGQQGATINVRNAIVEGGYRGDSVFDTDPQFANLPEGNLRLTEGSPAVDAGNIDFLPEDSYDLDGDGNTSEPIPLDLSGSPRLEGESVDLGAFEGTVDPVVANVVFVDANASGAGDGSSWSDAYISLQDALSSVSTGVDIWVAEGTYKPDQGSGVTEDDRSESFDLQSGVGLYGGFAGGETSLENRDIEANPTVLSGDIGVQEDASDNSTSVVYSFDNSTSAVLNGFTVTRGNANVSSDQFGGEIGGGLAAIQSSATIENVTFSRNTASTNGGGVGALGVESEFRNVDFINNQAESQGGGFYVSGGRTGGEFISQPSIVDATFVDNAATSGGGLSNSSADLSVVNARFEGNTASSSGGAVDNGAELSITNGVFFDNSADIAGGLSNDENMVLTNVTIALNTGSSGFSGGISTLGGETFLRNSIVWGNEGFAQIRNPVDGTTTVEDAIVEGGYSGTNVFNVEPMFADAPEGDLRLKGPPGASPAIDRGKNGHLPSDDLDLDGDGVTDERLPVDLRDNPRVQAVSSGNGAAVDLGAFESTGAPLPVELISVRAEILEGDRAIIRWETASEENNAGFAVQGRLGEDADWKKVGYVNSKAQGGTTTETKSYEYTVEDLPVGTHQFRLRQVDLDGSSTLTDPVTVDIQMQEAVKLTAPAPNPTSNNATLSFAVKEQAETTIRLYNTLGQQVVTVYEGTPQAGEEQRARVDVSGLSSGTYFLRLDANGQTRIQRLTVVR